MPRSAQNFTETSEFGDDWRSIEDGYGQSKWVAEQLVMRSQARGLPAFIYRLGEWDNKELFINNCPFFSNNTPTICRQPSM
jgi:hypothetical protein